MKGFSMQQPFLATLLAGIFFSVQAVAQPLSGTYTINPAQAPSATNFQNFTAAAASLGTNGVSAAVTFNVSGGTYNEQVLLNAVTGTSATNTITFSGNGATISANSVNPNNRAIIKLNGTDYVHIEGLNITATGNTSSEYGYGIQLLNGADYNTISGCTISTTKTSDGTATPNFAGIVINSSDGAVLTLGNANCNYNTIKENVIMGGYYGVALVAQATTYTINGNRIINNTIQDFYRTGIYMNGTVGTVVDNNDISRPSRPGTSFFQYFGLNLDGGNSGLLVTRNKLHDPFGENGAISNSSAYAMYINGSAGDQNAVNVFANNIVYNMNSNGIVGGFDITGSPYNRFVNNTVSVDDAGSSGFGFTKGFSVTGANFQEIFNNNVSIRRGGPGAKHCIYVGNTTGSTINNNNYFLSAGTTGYIGYFTTNRATLSDWQSASSFDVASISADPQFMAAASGNLLPQNTALQNGTPVANTGIATDINGLGRNAILPTMGAFEINGVVLPVKMSPLAGKLDTRNAAVLSWSTYTEVNNKGFEVQRSTDGKSWTGTGFMATKAPEGNSSNRIDYTFNEGIELGNTQYYRLQQTDIDGRPTISNVVVLNPAGTVAPLVLSIFPNPSSDKIRLELTGAAPEGTCTVLDQNGRQVKTQRVSSLTTTLDIHELVPGMYFLHYSNSREHSVVKFVKNK
jgi:parallel beta-helix repeat protein